MQERGQGKGCQQAGQKKQGGLPILSKAKKIQQRIKRQAQAEAAAKPNGQTGGQSAAGKRGPPAKGDAQKAAHQGKQRQPHAVSGPDILHAPRIEGILQKFGHRRAQRGDGEQRKNNAPTQDAEKRLPEAGQPPQQQRSACRQHRDSRQAAAIAGLCQPHGGRPLFTQPVQPNADSRHRYPPFPVAALPPAPQSGGRSAGRFLASGPRDSGRRPAGSRSPPSPAAPAGDGPNAG